MNTDDEAGGADMGFRAFVDESAAGRGDDQQEYLICAAIISDGACDEVREQLRSLLLPGQIKFHWTAESPARRRKIVSQIVDLGPMSVVVTHLHARHKKIERYRRKCLETLYHELISMPVFDVTLESRDRKQDSADREHIVALQSQGLDTRVRIAHLRGGDEPLLWIADTVLGAINAEHLGDCSFMDELRPTLLVKTRTPESK
ncbi:hypothetical protein [Demequina lutea]|uniref:DUF3800 domain-containing protein n=1 Tax=Demequina lutea TaxID=431489 RepID=A0A7Y9ZCT8_9MICO|nr:hypothetical protein [Demequina lutea]NYI42515.1 hypothetical protein [Demequina lutea]